MARRESRTTSELFREAFRIDRAQQIRKMIAEMNEMGRQSCLPSAGRLVCYHSRVRLI